MDGAQEALLTDLDEIIGTHIEATGALDDQSKYGDLCKGTRARIAWAVDAFLEEQAARVTESREVAFVRRWGQPSEAVRKEYVALLMRCSDNSGAEKLHEVRVTGYNPKGSHHWNLKASCYDSCQPTPRVLEAFAVVDGDCAIDPVPKFPRWGN